MARIGENAFRQYRDGQDRLTAREYMAEREQIRLAINDTEDKVERVESIREEFSNTVNEVEAVKGEFVQTKQEIETQIGEFSQTIDQTTQELQNKATKDEVHEVSEQLAETVEDLEQRGINVFNFNAVGDGLADDTTSIINAINYAVAKGGMVKVPAKTYRLTSTVYITCDLDAEGATFLIDHDLPLAIVIGAPNNAILWDKKLRLPNIIKKNKDWSKNCTGIQLLNTHACHVELPVVRNFATGLHMAAFSQGNVHNEIHLRQLDNNKVNLLLQPLNAGGWVNENNFYGGKFNHVSTEGVEVAGVKHIQLTSPNHSINNNVFYKPSIEGNTPEFQIELHNSTQNVFFSARYETGAGIKPKIKMEGISASLVTSGNVFFYGYGAKNLNFITGSHVKNNQMYSDVENVIDGSSLTGVTVIRNTSSSSSPALAILSPEQDAYNKTSIANNYAVALSADKTRYKRATDTFPRMIMDHVNGRVYMGNGTTEPVFNIRSYGSASAMVNGGNLYFDGTWNGSKIILGTYQIWVDSTGKLRMKNGAPTSETDGTIIGTQT